MHEKKRISLKPNELSQLSRDGGETCQAGSQQPAEQSNANPTHENNGPSLQGDELSGE